MKTTMTAVLLAVLACGLASAADDKDGGRTGDGTAACTPRMGRLAHRLGLSDDQVQRLHEANEARRKAVRPLREKLREEMKALRELVREDGGDAKIQASLEKVQSLRASIRAEREKFRKQAEAALTPAQRAKLMLAMASKRRHARQGFRGGPGFRGHRGGWQ
jgi:Spy/CpxP family protein refolding chaperone